MGVGTRSGGTRKDDCTRVETGLFTYHRYSATRVNLLERKTTLVVVEKQGKHDAASLLISIGQMFCEYFAIMIRTISHVLRLL